MNAANMEKLRRKLEGDGYRLTAVETPVEYGRFEALSSAFHVALPISNDWRAAAWILERSWPNEYARVTVERVEPSEEKDERKNLTILYQTGNQSLEELLSFPIHSSMSKQEHDSPEVGREKQRRLLGETAQKRQRKRPHPQETESPPPKVIHPALTGRLRPEWKGNGK